MLLKITLTEPIVPKARPRILRNKGTLPKKYRDWKERAKEEIEEQFEEKPKPLTKCSIKINLIGNHSKRGDIDNIAGAVIDALVDVQILKNDNLNHIPCLEIKFHENKEQPPIAEIYLTEV